MSKTEKRRLTISLEPDDYLEIAELARDDDRSLNWVINEAVKCYLELNRQSDAERPLRHQQTRLSL